MSELDEFDVKLLRLVQEDSRRTSEELAQEVGLSATACQRRLRRLREEGVIAREVAMLNPERIGGRMTVLVEITLQRGSPKILDDFKRRMRQLPEVQQCFYVTGDSDFVLIVIVDDIKAYEAFTQRVLFASETIQKFKTIVVMDTVKTGLTVPL